jgi:hypothetical protein
MDQNNLTLSFRNTVHYVQHLAVNLYLQKYQNIQMYILLSPHIIKTVLHKELDDVLIKS